MSRVDWRKPENAQRLVDAERAGVNLHATLEGLIGEIVLCRDRSRVLRRHGFRWQARVDGFCVGRGWARTVDAAWEAACWALECVEGPR